MAEATTTTAVLEPVETDAEYPPIEAIWVDPNQLLTDLNVREALLDPDLQKSIGQDGVLEMIGAVRLPDGRLRVRFGERRVLAAIAANTERVPVHVIGDEDSDDDRNAQRARIRKQVAENTYRKGLSTSELAGAAHQMALYGASNAEISRDLPIKRNEVKAARAVGASTVAGQAADAYELDLAQAAVLAEFETDPERVEVLLNAAANKRFDLEVERFRQDDARSARLAKLMAEIEAADITIVPDETDWNDWNYLHNLYNSENGPIDPAEHQAACPGHAVVIEEDDGYVTPDGTVLSYLDYHRASDITAERDICHFALPVCLKADELHPHPGGTGHTAPNAAQTQAEQDAERASAETRREEEAAARRRVREGNKEWRAATPVRRRWVKALLNRKTTPKNAGLYLMGELLDGHRYLTYGMERRYPLAAELFGIAESTPAGTYWGNSEVISSLADSTTTDKRALMVTLGLMFALAEASMDEQSWRDETGCTARRYLRFLIDNGYQACNVERRAAGLPEIEAPAADETEQQAA